MDRKVVKCENQGGSVGDQEVMSHTLIIEVVGKSRRGFPTGTNSSQSSHDWYEGSMRERGIVHKEMKKEKHNIWSLLFRCCATSIFSNNI